MCVCVCLWVGGCEGTIFSPHPPFSLRHTKFSREKPSNPIKLGQPLGKIGLPPQTTPLLSASLTITVCQPRLLRRDGCTTVITVGTAVQLLQLYSWYSSAVCTAELISTQNILTKLSAKTFMFTLLQCLG